MHSRLLLGIDQYGDIEQDALLGAKPVEADDDSDRLERRILKMSCGAAFCTD